MLLFACYNIISIFVYKIQKMQNPPIQYADLSYQVYEHLKEMIISGELKPGEKLRQEHIANSLGVSRMPLHKAFQMLEDELLVESLPRRGFYVRKPTLEEYIEAFECREALEGLAARKAAELMSLAEIDELRDHFIQFQEQVNIDIKEYSKADQLFHESIIKASGNNLLQKLNRKGNVLIRTFPKGIVMSVEESIQDHFRILKALEARNAELAEKLIKDHARKARDILYMQLNLENQ